MPSSHLRCGTFGQNDMRRKKLQERQKSGILRVLVFLTTGSDSLLLPNELPEVTLWGLKRCALVLSDCLWPGLLQHVWCSSLKLYIQTFQVGVNISCQRILWASDSPEPEGVQGKLQEWAPSLPTSLWVRAEEGLWLKAECVSFLLQMIKTDKEATGSPGGQESACRRGRHGFDS